MAQSACNSDQLQICGHHGALTASASTGRLWKQTTAAEVAAYQALQSDPLGPFLPRLYSWKETSLELEDLRASFGPHSEVGYDERFHQVRNAPLLILDDLGTQSNSE